MLGLSADIVLAAAFCLSFRGHYSTLFKVALLCFKDAEIISDETLCTRIAESLIVNEEVDKWCKISIIAIERCFPLDSVFAILQAPVNNAHALTTDDLIKIERLYDKFIKTSESNDYEYTGLIFYMKGSFLVTLKKQEKALESFRSAISINDGIVNYPALWSQTANICFWKGEWDLSSKYYLQAMSLQRNNYWETKANFADTQWRRGAIGSAIFWLSKVLIDEESKKDLRYSWFNFLHHTIKWAKEYLGHSRFKINPIEVTNRLQKVEANQSELSINELKELICLDCGRVDLWDRLVDLYYISNRDYSIRAEMMALACDYTNTVRRAYLLVRAIYDKSVDKESQQIIIELAVSSKPSSLAEVLYEIADDNLFSIPPELIYDLADNLESLPERNFSRTIIPMDS